MKPHTLRNLSLLILFSLLAACEQAEEYDADYTTNFEALWTILDQRYCFFDYKAQAYGLDWNEVHCRYAKRLADDMGNAGLFEVLADMVGELRDGHVNLIASNGVSYYRGYYTPYPHNFDADLMYNYLGDYYGTRNGLYYKMLDDGVGYLRCASFSTAVTHGAMDEVLNALQFCTALIVDVRDNTGGNLNYSECLASHFTNEKILTGYVCHKTGTGHNDFSVPVPAYLEPATAHVRWQKPVAVLANRRTFSAANDFVRIMRCIPGCLLVGDCTGGGSGLPMTQELPNGWTIRFSACPTYDVDMQHTELGIDPTLKVDLQECDRDKGIDTIIEAARKALTQNFAAQ